MDYLYNDLVNEDVRIFPEVKPIQLFKLPIKVADDQIKTEIEKLVKQTIDTKKIDKNTADLEKKIDGLVYKLYNISADEQKLIEGN